MIFLTWGFVAAIVYVCLLIESDLRRNMRIYMGAHFEYEDDFERALKSAFWPATVWFCIPRFIWTLYQYHKQRKKRG